MELQSVRFSILKEMARSPAHYRQALADGGREQTPGMRVGKAVHSLVLGGDPVLFFPGTRRGNAWDAFAASNSNAIILSEAEHEKVRGMAAAVRANPTAQLALAGRHEVEVDWSYLGRACRSHIDVVGEGGKYVTELKTAQTSDPARFTWNALRMHYNAQLAYYSEALRSSGAGEPLAHYVVVIEATAPFCVTTMRLTARALEQGQRSYRLWFERLLTCEAADAWPAYCESVCDLDVPDDETELVFGSSDAEVAA
jgi:hypothetical protein